jgi:outer membrane protein assembly factor BamB
VKRFADSRHLGMSAAATIVFFAASAVAGAAEPRSDASPAEAIVKSLGVHGGLCVQVGANDVGGAAELAATGRYLVHVLDGDEQAVERARGQLRPTGLYGLVSAERLPRSGGLPYTENLVNLLFIAEDSARVPLEEAMRILCPNGILVVGAKKATADELESLGFAAVRQVGDGGEWLVGRKPWPGEMDEWTHPRHSAAGNAASRDRLVAPPRRVRWVAGAEAEVRGMVTAAGRNFYAGVLARDGFNGLRLWQHDLASPSGGRFTMRNLGANSAAPIAGGGRLFAVEQQKLVALDGATGKPLAEYPDAGSPRDVLFDQGILIAVTSDSVRALYADSCQLKWSFPASDPRYVVAGDGTVALVQGQPRRNETVEAVVLDMESGRVRWRRSDLAWLPKATRTVYYRGLVAFEVSSLSNEGPENALHILSAADGKVQLDYPFLPGMNHRRQARAMFADDRLWLLHGGKDADKQRLPIQVSAIDAGSGQVLVTHPAGLTHCFPPVMTCRYMLSGEFDLTDLATGLVDAHRITKAACGPDGGWVPANGLIYVTPKHCVCWPMLRGYAALAPERPAGGIADLKPSEMEFPLETAAAPPTDWPPENTDLDWPMYRHDPWRSGSTRGPAPEKLDTLWSVDLGGAQAAGIIAEDWRENGFVKGSITSPVIAGERVVVARPDAHQVVGLDARTGKIAWQFTASGRVDTSPTLHKGLCLFGAKSGWVYCLRVDDGRLVWRLRAAPVEEQIIAYGQLESPWPVPGSVLVSDGVAYFAAGRQSLADGGILVFAADPATGKLAWVERLNSVPQQGFYESSALEFDNFDLLHQEGEGVGMSRWVFDRKTGKMSIDRWAVFARLNTGGGSVMAPRGCWSYAPRHQPRIASYTPLRSLAVYRDNVLYGCLQGSSTVFRRDFDLEGGEQFDTKWITGWEASSRSRQGEMPWPNDRLAQKAAWKMDPFGQGKDSPPIRAMALAGQRLLVAGADGRLRVISARGEPLAEAALAEPLWDGMAIAGGRLYYATRQGKLLCLGAAP